MSDSIVAPLSVKNQSPQPKSIDLTVPGPDVKVTKTVIEGRTYLVWHEADCYWVRSVVSGKVAQLFELDELNRFMADLRRDLAAKAARKALAAKPQIATFPFPLLPAPQSVPKIAGLLPAGLATGIRQPIKKLPVILSSRGIIYLPSQTGASAPQVCVPQVVEKASRPQYMRDIRKFIASKSGGGGFVFFGGEPRPWSWVMRNCRCAACGLSVRKHLSGIPADGHIRNAQYFTCEGPERHVIHSVDDLAWKIGAEARDQKHRAKASVKEVKQAYPWLIAEPLQEPDEELPV